jgi:hypothetical protein
MNNHYETLPTDAQSAACYRELFACSADVKQKVIEPIARGIKLILCGNAGSAADAQHLATELRLRLRPEANRPGIEALPLSINISTLTWKRGCIENSNGLLSQYIPKKRSTQTFTDEEIRMTKDRSNNRPSKRLEFKTPKVVSHTSLSCVSIRI